MKKYLLLLIAVCLSFGVYSQTKKISHAEVYYKDDTTPQRIYDFHYDEYGRLLGSDWNGRSSNDIGCVRVTYNDEDRTIKIESYEENPDCEWTMAYVENERITKLDFKYSDEDIFTIYFTYNDAGELISAAQEYYGETFSEDFNWLNDNILSVTSWSDGWKEFSLSDYDRPTSFPFFMECIDGVAGFDLPNPFYYLPDYMGKRTKKLVAGYTYKPDYPNQQCTYSYKFDAEGNVSEIISNEVEDSYSWRERIVCSYTTVCGINEVLMPEHNGHTAIYNMAGLQIPYMVKGFNIVKESNGTVRKVLVK